MTDNIMIEKKIKLLTFIWAFFILELLVLLGLTYFLLVPEQLTQSFNSVDVSVLYFSYIISISAIPTVFKIYDIQKKKLKKEISDKAKLEKYQLAVIIKFAVLEFAAIISLIAFYLNETIEPLYMFGIIFVSIFLNKPSYNQFEKDFLNSSNKNVIDGIKYSPNGKAESDEVIIQEQDNEEILM